MSFVVFGHLSMIKFKSLPLNNVSSNKTLKKSHCKKEVSPKLLIGIQLITDRLCYFSVHNLTSMECIHEW